MRIAADLSFFTTDQRGMGRVVRSILKELLAARGDEFVFFVRRTEDFSPVKEWARAVNPSVRLEVILRRDLPCIEADVCWYPWNRADVQPRSGRRIVTLHDVNPFMFPYRSLWRWWDQHRDEMRFHRAAKTANQIVTVSEFSRQEIIRHLEVAAEKVRVMPLGVDARWFAAPAAEHRPGRDEAGPGRFPLLLYVGADNERKNLRGLFEAMQILHQKLDCRATLMCCGIGAAAAQKYGPMLQKYDLSGAVKFAGFVPEEQLRALYANSDLFVFPSLYEGFGLPILEAMAAGLPVVTSRSASLPEVGGQAVIYFDAANPASMAAAIRDTWDSPALRTELRERGLQRAAQFTWGNAARALREIFEGKE